MEENVAPAGRYKLVRRLEINCGERCECAVPAFPGWTPARSAARWVTPTPAPPSQQRSRRGPPLRRQTPPWRSARPPLSGTSSRPLAPSARASPWAPCRLNPHPDALPAGFSKVRVVPYTLHNTSVERWASGSLPADPTSRRAACRFIKIRVVPFILHNTNVEPWASGSLPAEPTCRRAACRFQQS